MKLKSSILVWLIVMMLAVQSCGRSTSTPAPVGLGEEEQLGTAVAGTLTSAGHFPTATDTPVPTATITLIPTRTPGPLRVVYSRAGSIWIWTEGGQPKQLTNNIVDAKPRLSADGQLVVFERNNELYAVNSDGTNLHVLVSNSFLKPYIPSGYKFIWAEFYDWKLDTHLLYFTTKTGISGPETDKFQFDLFRADVDTGDVRQILPPGMGGVPYFSPDGKTIGLVQPKAIYLANTEGAGIRRALEFSLVDTGSEWFYFPILVPISDGSGFRTMIPGDAYLESADARAKIWNIPTIGEPILLDSSIQGLFDFYGLSMDGKSIGYTVSDQDKNLRVCVKNISSPPINSTPDYCVPEVTINGSFLYWSPNGTNFIYTALADPVTYGFYLVLADKTIKKIDTYVYMYWVDSNRYLYVSGDGNLYLANLEGTQTWIDKGISGMNVKTDRWPWQFDFSN